MPRLALCLLLSLLFKVDSPPAKTWTGVWKMDAKRGHLIGDTFRYVRLNNGTWQVSSGGAVDFTFVENGTPYPTTDPANSVAVTRVDDRTWTLSRRNHDKEWDNVQEQVSADGATLTSVDHEQMDDGSTNVVTTAYQRVGRGRGFAGTWKSTQLSGPHVNWIFPFGYVMKDSPAGTVHWEIPSYHITVEGKCDGTPILLTPPGAEPVTVVTVRRLSPEQFATAIVVAGKTVRRSTYRLAKDGQSFSQDSWDPAKPQEVRTAVFVRQ